jgi:protein-disulfide isomerase
MTNPADNGKKARREHAREVARLEREAAAKRTRRTKLALQGGLIVVVLAIVAIVAVVITTSAAPAGPGPRNMASDGILFTGVDGEATPVETEAVASGESPTATDLTDYADTVNIVTYIDYACPACQSFEQTNAEQIAGWVAAGVATLEIHPVSILDRMSLGTKYSSRSANAAACVAQYQPEAYLDVTTALYAGQPEEGTSGLDTAALTALVTGAGADDADVVSCIEDNTFEDWVSAATQRVSDGEFGNSDVTEFEGTPTVLVNGELYEGLIDDAEQFAAFVQEAADAS